MATKKFECDITINGTLVATTGTLTTLFQSGLGYALGYQNMQLNSSSRFLWSQDGAYSGAKDVGLYRPSAGLLQIYDGATVGNLRDLKLRTLTADTSIIITTAPTTSAGTYEVLTRNLTTGIIEKKASSFFQAALTNPITGTGTTNRFAKFTSTGVIGNSSWKEDAGGRMYNGTSSDDYNTIQVTGTITTDGITSNTIWSPAITAIATYAMAGSFSSGGYGKTIEVLSTNGVAAVFDTQSLLNGNESNIVEFKDNNVNQVTISNTGIITTNGIISNGPITSTSSVQVGDDTNLATQYNAGALRYRSLAEVGYPEIVTQNSFGNYSWKTLYHAGNFTPGNYLPLAGGTLTGALIGTTGTFTTLAQTASGFSFGYANMQLNNTSKFFWSQDGSFSGAKDTALYRPSAGTLRIYDGVTLTNRRDLNLRTLYAETSVVITGGGANQFMKANGTLDNTVYQPLLTNPITGTGTIDRLTKFTSGSALGDSSISEVSGRVLLSTTDNGVDKLQIFGSIKSYGYQTMGLPHTMLQSDYGNTDVCKVKLLAHNPTNGLDADISIELSNNSNVSIERLRIKGSNGNVLINTTTDNAVDKLQVNGSLIATEIKKSGGTGTNVLLDNGTTATIASLTTIPTLQQVTTAGATTSNPIQITGVNSATALDISFSGEANGVIINTNTSYVIGYPFLVLDELANPLFTVSHTGVVEATLVNSDLNGKINRNSNTTISDLNIISTDNGTLRFDTFSLAATNKPVSVDNANGVISMFTNHGPQYGKQIAFADNDDLYIRSLISGGYQTWRKLWHDGNLTNLNQLTNGPGYITSVPAQSFASLTGKPTTLAGYGITDSGNGLQSLRNFTQGTLITTSIDYSVTNGSAFFLKIEGNSYSSNEPTSTELQGYIYNDTIISYSMIANESWNQNVIAMNVGGNLCFWYPYMAYWQGFTISCFDVTQEGVPTNKVTSITNVANPAGTKQVTFTPRKKINSYSIGTYAPTLTGTGASGTWGISITGNASSATLAHNLSFNNNSLASLTYGGFGGILQDDTGGPEASQWSNRLKMLHNNASGFYTELAQNFTGTEGLWHRRNVNGAVSTWKKVWDSANLTNLNQLTNGPGYLTTASTLQAVTTAGATTNKTITINNVAGVDENGLNITTSGSDFMNNNINTYAIYAVNNNTHSGYSGYSGTGIYGQGQVGGHFVGDDGVGYGTGIITIGTDLGASITSYGPNIATFYTIGSSLVAAIESTGKITATAGTAATHVVVKSQLDLKSNLASPTFTGTPTAPTATVGTNTTQLATTAFVLANANSPNAVLLTGNQSIMGVKSFNNTGTTINSGLYFYNTATANSSASIFLDNSSTGNGIYGNNISSGNFQYINNQAGGAGTYVNNTSTGRGIQVANSSGGLGIYVSNSSTATASAIGVLLNSGNTAPGVYVENNSSGTCYNVLNTSTGKSIVLNNTTAGTGTPFTIQKQGTDKLTISDAGVVDAAQYKLAALNTAPASATAAGTLGEIRWDANYMYVCTATNTWKRSAIATW